MNDVVEFLTQGLHPIEFETRTSNYDDIKNRIQKGFVYVKFTDTRGGTELGINVDSTKTSNFEDCLSNGQNMLHLEGVCKLNYKPVRCIIDVNVSTRKGEGRLVIEAGDR